MIVISNMEKPKSCYNHCLEDFIANKEIGCPLKDYVESHQFKRSIHPNCPLIEIDESEMEYLYKEFGLEEDENLTERAKELKRAILMGYLYAKKEIVRCKECIHRIEDSDFQSGHFCLKRRGNGGLFCEDNDSCSYGEREFNEKCR